MKEYIFTFGWGQTPNQNYFYAIWAENAGEARQKMVEKFGTKWSMQYDSREAAGVYKFNLIEYKG